MSAELDPSSLDDEATSPEESVRAAQRAAGTAARAAAASGQVARAVVPADLTAPPSHAEVVPSGAESRRAALLAGRAASRAAAPAAGTAAELAREDTAAAAEKVVVAELAWGRLLHVTLARAVLSLLASLLLWSVLPVVLGWTPQLILSGSMEPRIHVGDVVVTRRVDPGVVRAGHVVTVTDPDHPGRTRTHRVLRRESDGTLVLKGDANRQADSSHVASSAVRGVAVLRVPYVGRPAYWLTERNWPALVGAALVLGWCLVAAFPRSRTPEQPGAGGGPGSGPRRVRRRVVAVAAVGIVAVGGASDPAAAAFKRAAANPTSSISAATTFYPYRTAVLADSPYLFWRLDETSGTAVSDETTNNRGGTLSGTGYTWKQAGALAGEAKESALALTSGYITASSSAAATSAFSVEAWFKTSSSTGGRILGFGDKGGTTASTALDRQLYLGSGGKVYFGVGSNKTTITSNTTLNNGVWHHVVGTYATGTNGMKLYVDGTQQTATGTATATTGAGYWRAGSDALSGSGWAGTPDNQFDGSLEELAVFSSTLTSARVKAHYDAGSTP